MKAALPTVRRDHQHNPVGSFRPSKNILFIERGMLLYIDLVCEIQAGSSVDKKIDNHERPEGDCDVQRALFPRIRFISDFASSIFE